MNPIRYSGVIAFIDWISRRHPEIRSLKDTTEEEFLGLATEYEASKGMMIDPNHQVYMKWRSTHWCFSRADSDQEALEKLR
jgi:hypothetical protein